MARATRPVEVVYYPKRSTRAPRRAVAETVETQIIEEPSSRRSRGTRTDEIPNPTEQAFANLTRLGHEAFEAGRHDDARIIFESLVVLGRRDAFSHTMLGTILLGAQSYDAALAQFEAALAIDANELAALVYRGEIRLARRKLGRACEDLERAVQLGPANDPFVARAKKLLGLARANRTT